MEKGSGFGSPMMVALAVLVFAMVVMVPEVSATRWTVGSNMGWTNNVNYTIWAQGKHFYNGDWLFFVYDRNQMNILEVNKTDYESCNSDHPLHNWTRGAGRDVVPLNVTRNYYFISGKGFCYGGMKLAVHVENPPPPPTASPLNEKSGSPSSIFRSQYVLPTVFAIGALWDAFVWSW
ncbi:PREDICTED: lamin-like protein [Populus euphratica]|uniref:Lamin-like protein n=1 Tax=Populus euphratica TaxID=75702 RepID=A0AAJ6UTV6_POPEU|nr:PREDICTED: lamin-like protein [Populus euphratica]